MMGTTILADSILIKSNATFDMIVLPGGASGAKTFAGSEILK